MITVRKMLLEDVEGVMEVDRDSFSLPWSRESFILEVKSPISYYVVAEDETGKIIAYGGFYLIIDQVEITNIAVLSKKRGQGIGKSILEVLLKIALVGGGKLVNLEVRESNEAAKAMYYSYGFSLVGKRKGYYQLPSEDALLLSLVLEEGRFDD